MMRIIGVLILAFLCSGFIFTGGDRIATAIAPDLINAEGFEGTSAPTDWSTSGSGGTFSWDSTTYFHTGAQSLATDGGTNAVSPSWSAQTEVWCDFWLYPENTKYEFFFWAVNNNTSEGYFKSYGDTNIRLCVDGTNADDNGAITNDAWNHVWIHYKASSGSSDGEFALYIDTDDTVPASATAEISGHNDTTAMTTFGFDGGGSGYEQYYDDVNAATFNYWG